MYLNAIGIKCGMTRYFLENEFISIPVTVIFLDINKVVNTKLIKDKYFVQLTTGIKKKNKINKSIIGHYKKYSVLPGKILKTFSFPINNNIINFYNKKELYINDFLNFKYVNITGTSKGKGFTGVIKRWNFKTQDATHGNSLSHRAPGSIGQNQSPGRVFKGKKMAGHYGNINVTIKKLKIIKFNFENKVFFVKGSVPGFNSNFLFLKFYI